MQTVHALFVTKYDTVFNSWIRLTYAGLLPTTLHQGNSLFPYSELGNAIEGLFGPAVLLR